MEMGSGCLATASSRSFFDSITADSAGWGTSSKQRVCLLTATRTQELMKMIGPAYGAALESGLPSLVAQLDAELAARDANRGPEPELRAPKAAGPIAGLQPIVFVE